MDLSQLPTDYYILLAVAATLLLMIITFIAVVLQGRRLKVAWLGLDIGEKPKDQKQRDRPRGETLPDQKVADLPQTRPLNVNRVAGNDLGKGVEMGGKYRDRPQNLELVSSDWARWRDGGWVKSGWFYNPPDSDLSHAVAFFKIHCRDDGTGFVQVLSASNRPHEIWLQTNTGSEQKHSFSYRVRTRIKSDPEAFDALMAHWRFTWEEPSSP